MPVGIERLRVIDDGASDIDGRALARGNQAADIAQAAGIDRQAIAGADNGRISGLLLDEGLAITCVGTARCHAAGVFGLRTVVFVDEDGGRQGVGDCTRYVQRNVIARDDIAGRIGEAVRRCG